MRSFSSELTECIASIIDAYNKIKQFEVAGGDMKSFRATL